MRFPFSIRAFEAKFGLEAQYECEILNVFRNRLLKIAFNMGIPPAVLKRYFAGPLQQVVREALLLRVVGSGHSSTSLSAAPGETMMSLSSMGGVISELEVDGHRLMLGPASDIHALQLQQQDMLDQTEPPWRL